MGEYPRGDKVKTGPCYLTDTWDDGSVTLRWAYPPRFRFSYSDSKTQKRLRPPIPELHPTSLRRCHAVVDGGRTSGFTPRWRPSSESRFRSTEFTETSWMPINTGHIFSLLSSMARINNVWVPTRSIEGENLADLQMLERIKNSHVHLPTAVAEAGKTASWLQSRAQSLIHAITSVKHGKWARLISAVNNRAPIPRRVQLSMGRYGYVPASAKPLPRREPKGWSTRPVAERWLEVNYAVMPLVNDLGGLAILIAQLVWEGRLSLYQATGKSYRSYSNLIPFRLQAAPESGVGIIAPIRTLRVLQLVCDTTSCSYTLTEDWPEWVRRASQQLALPSLAQAAWEVTPWSFVLDWGITFGAYLDSLTASVGAHFGAGTRSRSAFLANQGAQLYSGSNGNFLLNEGRDPAIQMRAYTRDVLAGFPRPVVVVKSPLSTSHGFASLALLRVQYQSLR